MEWSRKRFYQLLALVALGVLLFGAVQRLEQLLVLLAGLVRVVSPFLLGLVLAFIFNVPMRAIERHLPRKGKRWDRLRRPVAYVLTLLCVAGVLAVALFAIVPGVRTAASSALEQFPDAMERLNAQLAAWKDTLPAVQEMLAQADLNWQEIAQKLTELVQNYGKTLLTSGGGLIGGMVSGVVSFFVGFVFSIYVLLQKERLGRQGRQCLYALLPERTADQVLEVLRLSDRVFSNFLSGQCLEACILGSMFVVSMMLLRMPYALLVGVLIALTALIPIVGAFIGCVVGTLLIALNDPWQAAAFVVLFLVLQQIEGNLIYPHVVGSSVGLPSIWVLAAVTVGGNLFGIAGMLFFIPLCSVLYALFRRFVWQRLHRKGVAPEKWQGMS